MSAPVVADLFCRVVDNYGDIGMGWRLARQLAKEYGWTARLWVDDLNAFARIEPRVNAAQTRQDLDTVRIIHWTEPGPALAPGEVVIEMFACDPPPAYVSAMRARPPLWINLEYLSAEAWIETCHALPSRRSDGLSKFFFFPGFTPATGGLPKAADLLARRDAVRTDPVLRRRVLRQAGLTDALIDWHEAGARLITLFCYASAPLAALCAALDRMPQETLLVVPEGVAPDMSAWLDGLGRQASVRVARVPFMSQTRYDALLWCADLNIVRGEDSFVTAIWTGRPLIWHIYPQGDQAHLVKLDAWLDRYRPPRQVRALMRAFNAPAQAREPLTDLIASSLAGPGWTAWQTRSAQFCAEQAAHDDLARALLLFYATQHTKKS